MGKRKREKDETYLERKIERYKTKLEEKRRKRGSPSQTPDSDISFEGSRDEVILSEHEVDENIPPVLTPEQITTSGHITTEILNLLGEAKKSGPVLGPPIPEEISERWGKILIDGLGKEYKETLKEKLLIPENFTLVQAPKLNLEVSSILPESAKNRDKHLEQAQNQLGLGVAGLVNLTRDIIHAQPQMDKLHILQRISEISQILLDLHHEETFNRRKLIVPILDKNFWSIIKGVKRDEFLFGTKLGENIKNSKDIEKSSLQIKKTPPTSTSVKRRVGFQQGNAQGPPRRVAPTTSRLRQQSSSVKRTAQPTHRYRSRPPGVNKKNRH